MLSRLISSDLINFVISTKRKCNDKINFLMSKLLSSFIMI